jgi:hypothetical protein
MESHEEIDLDLLRKNLELSPTERLTAHQRALELLLEIDRARDEMNEKSKQSA